MRGRRRLAAFLTAGAVAVASVQIFRVIAEASPPGHRTLSVAEAQALAAGAWHGKHRKAPRPAHQTTVSVKYASGAPSTSTGAPTGGAAPAKTPAAHAATTAAAPVSPEAGTVTPSAPFTQCPAIGADSSCGNLVEITDGGTSVLSDPSQGPYDGADDTLIGVVNDSGGTVSQILLSSDTIAFAFDGDGICDGYVASPPCPYGPTGYEGPGTSFSDINSSQTAGAVNFATPLPPGGTAYFSLEEALAATTVFGGGPSTAEQGGAPNGSEEPSTCDTHLPVNCATGEFWHTFTDFSVPGRGMPLALSRTYTSSAAAVDGPFGFGWTDSYAMSLSTDAAGDVTVDQENGSSVTFVPAAGGYTAPPRVLATLTRNADGTSTFVRDVGHVRDLFSTSGRLMSETDLNGEVTTLAYNGTQLESVTDPAGRTLTFTYSGSHIVSVADPLNRKQAYAYDAAGNLASSTDAASRTWHFGYDPNHLLLTVTDPRGGVVANVYDASGRVTSQTDPKGAKTTWAYAGSSAGSGGGSTTITDPDGAVTTEQYANLELTSITAATGTAAQAVTTFTRDAATLGLTTVTDPDGNVTRNTYDGHGNLLSTADPLGRTTSYAYNALDERTMVIAPSGVTTQVNYDAAGNAVSTVDNLGGTTTYAHADTAHPGDVTSVTDPVGRAVAYTYDAYGDVASKTVTPSPGVGDTVTAVFDADGEQLCTASAVATAGGHTCPAGGGSHAAGTTTTGYDAVGEATSVTDPNGKTTTRTYDADGNLLTSTDADGNVTTRTYDADNLVVSVAGADGTKTATSYDADGNVLAQTDGAGDSTTYAYDALNRSVSKTDPLARPTAYGYDPAGNLIAQVDASARTTTVAYDKAGEPTSTTFSDGVTPSVSFTYTADGKRSSMVDGTGTTTYAYDPDDRLAGTVNGAGASVGYTYDAAGEVTAVAYPDGNSITRTYDGAGRLSAVKDWLGGTTSFAYDRDGNVVSQSSGNGAVAASTYDAADRLTGIQDTHDTSTLASYAYTRDAVGQVASDTEIGTPTAPSGGAAGTAVPYTYDALNRVVGVGTGRYGYDAAGRPTGLPGGVVQAFDAAGQLTSTGPVSNPTPTPTPTATSTTPAPTSTSTSSTPAPTTTSTSSTPAPTTTSTSSTPAPTTTSTPSTPAPTSTSTSSTPAPTSTTSTPSPTPTTPTTPTSTLTPTPTPTPTSTSSSATPAPTTTPSSTPPPPPGSPAIDKFVNGVEQKSASPITAPPLSTSAGGELLLAFVSADGPTGQRQRVTSVSGAGLTWTLASRANQVRGTGTAEVWQAYASTPLKAAPVKAALAFPNWDGAITVVAYSGAAATVGATANDGARSGPPSVTLTTTTPGSLVVAAGHNWSHAVAPTPAAGQSILTLNLDTRVQDTYWTQTTGVIATPGKATVADTAPKDGRWEFAAVEVEPAHAAAAASPHRALVAAAAPTATTAYAYDPEGDRTSATPAPGAGTTYAYDQAHRLVSATTSGVAAGYAYDGDGLRTSKKVNGTSTSFTWDVRTSTPMLLSDGTTEYVYGPGGSPIEQITGTTPTYLMTDQAGSVRLLTDAGGTVTGAYTYDAYGNTVAHTGTATTALQYNGQYADAETGFLYLRARYYDPATAQFLSRDPVVGITGSPYGYAGQNPVNADDPSGLSFLSNLNPANWSGQTWRDIATGATYVGIAVAVTALTVGTLGAGDVVLAAGAGAVATESGVVGGVAAVGLSSEAVGVGVTVFGGDTMLGLTATASYEALGELAAGTAFGADAMSAVVDCRGGSAACLYDVGATVLDRTGFGVGKYVEKYAGKAAERLTDGVGSLLYSSWAEQQVEERERESGGCEPQF